ncbi:unnamed protein product [Ceratitis capitata]|uniref:(Mediterranean fruit fly) hypothetical protein n=1 Tax=Ceratitis capitata TaxID=7213 RepID=A0A811V494_CERCA|nr:unnamed protein product [Ceratitis capitata]
MEIMFPKHRDYKTRNILTMMERVQVIKAYKRMPNYQRLASRFGCSAKQIKNIISKKDALLRHYDNVRANKETDEAATRRQEKIDFLGKVVYEFLLRALYLRMPISTSIIRQKAFEVKEAIAIENFSPNNSWLQDFRATYNRLDLTGMMERLPSDMEKRQSLKCIDIIDYVSGQEREERRRVNVLDDENCNNLWESGNDNSSTYSNDEHTMGFNMHANEFGSSDYDDEESVNTVEPIVVDLEADDEAGGESVNEVYSSAVKKGAVNNNNNNNNVPPLKPITPPPFADIHSYPEALRHLRVLEDFAMIEENYRAIGLITQLEQIFKNPPKLKRITH